MGKTRKKNYFQKKHTRQRRRKKKRTRRQHHIKQRPYSIMRRRRKHNYMRGGSNYSITTPSIQVSDNKFTAGFIAGYNSCVPQVHFQGYTHPI